MIVTTAILRRRPDHRAARGPLDRICQARPCWHSRTARGRPGEHGEPREVAGQPLGLGAIRLRSFPPITAFYIEHRTQRLRCPDCRKRTRAALGVVGESAFGPNLQAAVVTLTARNRISRRCMRELAGELFQVGLSIGAVAAIWARAGRLLEGPHERLTAQVLGSGAINVDETGWFLRGANRTLWTAATLDGAVFKIMADRHRDRLTDWIGAAFEGIVTSDRWWATRSSNPEQRQACWSHLQRDFRSHTEELLPEQRTFGDAGLA